MNIISRLEIVMYITTIIEVLLHNKKNIGLVIKKWQHQNRVLKDIIWQENPKMLLLEINAMLKITER
jgi:hypothetical protein